MKTLAPLPKLFAGSNPQAMAFTRHAGRGVKDGQNEGHFPAHLAQPQVLGSGREANAQEDVHGVAASNLSTIEALTDLSTPSKGSIKVNLGGG